MMTLYEELVSLYRELLARHRPGRRPGPQGLQTGAAPALTGQPEIPADDPHLDTLARDFPRELFARLLLELPRHRRLMVESFATGNCRRLRDSVHQILGAAAYCGADELEQGLRQLQLALKTDDSSAIGHCYHRAIQAIDNTLHTSGFHRQPE